MSSPISSSSLSTSSAPGTDTEMDVCDADTEDFDSSPLAQLIRAPSLPPTTRLKFEFIVSGYEKKGSTPIHQGLLKKTPTVVYQANIWPVASQIKMQINRNKPRIFITVKALEEFSEMERGEIRARHGIEGPFTLVLTKSNGARDMAMKRLMEAGLFFGAPELKVQIFREEDVGMGGSFLGDYFIIPFLSFFEIRTNSRAGNMGPPQPFNDMTSEIDSICAPLSRIGPNSQPEMQLDVFMARPAGHDLTNTKAANADLDNLFDNEMIL